VSAGTKNVVEIEGVPVPIDAAYDWRLSMGLAAPVQGWEVPAFFESRFRDKIGQELTLTLGDKKIERVVFLGTTGAGNPLKRLFLFSDVRWYLTRAWIAFDANARKTGGDRFLIGDGPPQVQTLIADVQFRPHSLQGPGSPFTDRSLLEYVLGRATRAKHGRRSITWTADSVSSNTGSRTIQETLVDDELPAGLARALGAVGTRSLFVDLAGTLHVCDALLGAEAGVIARLNPDGALQGQGHLAWADWSASRPREGEVYRGLFDPEYEVRLDFDPLATRERRDPYVENVGKTTDLSTTLTTVEPGRGSVTRVVGPGSIAPIENLFTAWGSPAEGQTPNPGPLTLAKVCGAFMNSSLERNYVGTYLPTPSTVWGPRVSQTRSCWFTKFRANPTFWAGVRSAKVVRAAVRDQATGTRGPSPVYADHAILPYAQSLKAAATVKTGFNVTSWAARLADGKVAPATVSLEDAAQGIFQLHWTPDTLQGQREIAPAKLVAPPGLDITSVNGYAPLVWSLCRLETRPRISFVVSCVPAGPNTEARLFSVPVTVQRAWEVLGARGDVPRGRGPSKDLRCRLTTARVAWSDDGEIRTKILDAFDPDAARNLEAEPRTVADVVPVNYDQELAPAAEATAALELASTLDHYEGTLSIPMTDVLPIGSLKTVVHRVTPFEASTILSCSGEPVLPNPFSLLPASARKILQREVQA